MDPTDVGESWVAALSRYHTAATPLPPSPGKGWDESAFVTSRPKLVAQRTQAPSSATRAQAPPAAPAARRSSQQYERARDDARTPPRERTSWLAGLFKPHEGSTARRLSKRLSMPLVGALPSRSAARMTSGGTARTASTQRVRPTIVLTQSADARTSWGADAKTNDDADASTHTVIDTQAAPAQDSTVHSSAYAEHSADARLEAYPPPAHADGAWAADPGAAAPVPPSASQPVGWDTAEASGAWNVAQPTYPTAEASAAWNAAQPSYPTAEASAAWNAAQPSYPTAETSSVWNAAQPVGWDTAEASAAWNAAQPSYPTAEASAAWNAAQPSYPTADTSAVWNAAQPSYPPVAASSSEATGLAPALSYPTTEASAGWNAAQPSYPTAEASSSEATGLAPALSYLHVPVVPWPTYLSHDTSSPSERAAPRAYAPPEIPVRRTDASVRAQRHWSMPTSLAGALFPPADTSPQLAPPIGAVAGRAASPFLPARFLAPASGAPRAVSTPVRPAPQRSASGAFKWRAPGSFTARRRSQPLPPLRPPPESGLPPIPDVPDTSGSLPMSERSGNEAFGFAV